MTISIQWTDDNGHQHCQRQDMTAATAFARTMLPQSKSGVLVVGPDGRWAIMPDDMTADSPRPLQAIPHGKTLADIFIALRRALGCCPFCYDAGSPAGFGCDVCNPGGPHAA